METESIIDKWTNLILQESITAISYECDLYGNKEFVFKRSKQEAAMLNSTLCEEIHLYKLIWSCKWICKNVK